MNTIIVDDDIITQDIIESYSGKTNVLNVVKKCSDAMEASEILLKEKIDLIFLDVMLPEMTGFDLMKNFNGNRPQVIMMTSEKNFASDAFDLDVTDFLVKPIAFPRFLKAVSKAKKNYDSQEHPGTDENIFVKANGRLLKINSKDIFLIEALSDYVAVHTSAKRYIVHSSMKSIEQKLSTNDFIRIHNSFIARIDMITEIEDGTIVINNKIVPVSRAHRKDLMNRLKLL